MSFRAKPSPTKKKASPAKGGRHLFKDTDLDFTPSQNSASGQWPIVQLAMGGANLQC